MTFKVKDGISVAGSTFVDGSRNTTTNNLTVGGNLTVSGTTTTINTATLEVADLNITVAKNAATAAAANGAGLTVAGAAATILYTSATDTWNFNKNIVATLTGNAATSTNASSAIRISFADRRSVVQTPGYFGAGTDWSFMANSTDGLSDGGSYHGVMHYQPYTDASGGGAYELGFTDNNNLWLRGSSGALTTFAAWKKIWDSGNLTNLNQLTNGPGYVTSSGVTSVATSGTVSGLTLTGGTITTTGTITLGGTLSVLPSNFASQAATTVLASPTLAAGVPTFRTLTLEDLPDAFVKRSVRAATTANITLSAPQTIDGIVLVAGDRVLVKNQTKDALKFPLLPYSPVFLQGL